MATGRFYERDEQDELSGLVMFSCVVLSDPAQEARDLAHAARVYSRVCRMGVRIPFWAVRDVISLLTHPVERLRLGISPSAQTHPAMATEHRAQVSTWSTTLAAVGSSPTTKSIVALSLQEHVLAALVGSLWTKLEEHRQIAEPEANATPEPLATLTIPQPLQVSLPPSLDRLASDLELLRYLTRYSSYVATAFEFLDVETCRLFAVTSDETGADASLADNIAALLDPGSADAAAFSMDLLPAVLEIGAPTGAQRISIDGYAGIDRRGSIDSMMMSEFAHDDDVFTKRFLDDELLFYAREKFDPEHRVRHVVCVDASASMRGRRQTFARALALTLVNRFARQKEDADLRFFDAQLYDGVRSRPRDPSVPKPNMGMVLTFRGERGRNYSRVFRALTDLVARMERTERTEAVIYVITHGECHVPKERVDALARIAPIYGIFIAPSSGALELDYVSSLAAVQVVHEDLLYDRVAQRDRAFEIVRHATRKRT